MRVTISLELDASVMARGRDATDAAISTTFGKAKLKEYKVLLRKPSGHGRVVRPANLGLLTLTPVALF